MVGAVGFELTTTWSQTRCATRLRYAPNLHIVPSESQIACGAGNMSWRETATHC